MEKYEDYELLFTVALKDYEILSGIQKVSIIGYIAEKDKGSSIIGSDGKEIELKTRGWG